MQSFSQKIMSAEEAAEWIQHGEVLGISGFTLSGYPKAVPEALAKKAMNMHAKGEEFKVSVFSGASTGDDCDGVLARAGAIQMRMPYQSNPFLRKAINEGHVQYIDAHLSVMAPMVRSRALPKPSTALIECIAVTPEGRVYLSASGGNSTTYLECADQIILEINAIYNEEYIGIHDTFIAALPPFARAIPIQKVCDRVGKPYVQVDPKKIKAIVYTESHDRVQSFEEPDATSKHIAFRILDFINHEQKKGRLPAGLAYQSGVGNVANAVLCEMASDPRLNKINLYTEVIQEAVIPLLEANKLGFASGTALTLSVEAQKHLKSNISQWKNHFILRQQEISNHPEVIRRLGIISMNTALEMDIFGNVNSSHVNGSSIMNGIGGSADYARSCYLGFFMTPSVAKGGTLSTIVPMVSHVDHTDHDTMIFVTEQGLADLRALDPMGKAKRVIENCAHPDFRPELLSFLKFHEKQQKKGRLPIDLQHAFDMHIRAIDSNSMI